MKGGHHSVFHRRARVEEDIAHAWPTESLQARVHGAGSVYDRRDHVMDIHCRTRLIPVAAGCVNGARRRAGTRNSRPEFGTSFAAWSFEELVATRAKEPAKEAKAHFMMKRAAWLADHLRARPPDEVSKRLPIQVRRNAEQRADARLLDVLRAEQRMEVPVARMPSTVVFTLHPVRLDLGVHDDARVVRALAARAQNPQQEVVVLQRSNAVLHTLEFSGEKPDGVERRPAACPRSHKADRMLRSDDDRSLAVVHECQWRPVIARQPGRRSGGPDREHTTAHDVRVRVFIKRARDGRDPVRLRSHVVIDKRDQRSAGRTDPCVSCV